MDFLLRHIERCVVAINCWLLILLLGAMACLVFTNVLLRYLTNESIVWAEEVARHLMIWLTFIGSGFVLRLGGHIALDALHSAAPRKLAIAARVIIVAILGGLFPMMVYTGLSYLDLMRFQTTPATQISYAWIYAALPIGFALLLIHLVFVARTFIACGTYKDWREAEAGKLPY